MKLHYSGPKDFQILIEGVNGSNNKIDHIIVLGLIIVIKPTITKCVFCRIVLLRH